MFSFTVVKKFNRIFVSNSAVLKQTLKNLLGGSFYENTFHRALKYKQPKTTLFSMFWESIIASFPTPSQATNLTRAVEQ